MRKGIRGLCVCVRGGVRVCGCVGACRCAVETFHFHCNFHPPFQLCLCFLSFFFLGGAGMLSEMLSSRMSSEGDGAGGSGSGCIVWQLCRSTGGTCPNFDFFSLGIFCAFVPCALLFCCP